MQQSSIIFIVLAGAVFLLIGILTNYSGGSLNSIKSKTVGDGQHGTARWATGKEITTRLTPNSAHPASAIYHTIYRAA